MVLLGSLSSRRWRSLSRRWTASPRRLGDSDRFRVVDEGGLEAVGRDVLLPGANLDSEVLVVPLEDLIWSVVRSLERGLLEVSSDKDEFGCS